MNHLPSRHDVSLAVKSSDEKCPDRHCDIDLLKRGDNNLAFASKALIDQAFA